MSTLTRILSGSLLNTGVVWTPANISSVFWLDASDASTITDSGGNVTTWADKSGNGNDANGGGGATTGIRTLNALNVIDFDGVGNYLNIDGITQRDADDFMIMGVFDIDATTLRYMCAQTGGSPNQVYGVGTGRMYLATDGTTVYTSGEQTGAAHLVRLDINYTGTTAQTYIDGVLEATDTMTKACSDSTVRVGAYWNGGSRLDGGIAELIMTNDRSAGTVANLTTYLTNKWGL